MSSTEPQEQTDIPLLASETEQKGPSRQVSKLIKPILATERLVCQKWFDYHKSSPLIMTHVSFSIVDVFSTTPFKGNPLAVVDNTQANLSTVQMQLLARQFNLSETTFFSPSTITDVTYRLRSFLPDGKEVFGAGHNILGVWWYLAAAGKLDFSKADSPEHGGTETFTFRQELGDQVLPVKVLRMSGSSTGEAQYAVSIRQASPKYHGVHPAPAALAQSLGLETVEIGFGTDSDAAAAMKPQVLSTSTTHHLFVPVSSVDALDRVVFQRDKLLPELHLVDKRAYGVYLFTPTQGTSGINSYQARFFSPGMSGEDPATGSAAGPLSAYLYKNRQLGLVGSKVNIEVLQGLKVGRQCLIQVLLSKSERQGIETLDVDLKGSGVMVAGGEIIIPDAATPF